MTPMGQILQTTHIQCKKRAIFKHLPWNEKKLIMGVRSGFLEKSRNQIKG